MLSERISSITLSPTRKFNQLAEKVSEKGIKIHRLSVGAPDIDAPELFFEALKEYPTRNLSYPNSKGTKEMIASQKAYYEKAGLSFDASEIFVTLGASEAIIFSLYTLLDEGDEVLLFEPFYTNYALFSTALNIRVNAVTTSIENNYEIPSLEVLEAHVSPKTKAILLSNPGNPTGRVYTREELDRIVSLAEKYHLFLIADEVYREFIFCEHPFISLAEYPSLEQQLILLDSASKKYAACGARIGTLATKNKEVAQSISKLCSLRLAAPAVEQYALSTLTNLPPDYFDGVRAIYRKRKQTLESCLGRIPDIKFSTPEGAFYTLVKLPVDSGDRFVEWTLGEFSDHNETVLITPAEGFYYTEGEGVDEVRISYCVDERVLERAVEIIDLALQVYPGSKRQK